MRLKFCLILIMLTLNAWALDERECTEQAELYGNGEGRSMIHPSCIAIARGSAPASQRHSSQDGKLVIFGYSNVIHIEIRNFMTDPPEVKHEVIAGSSTLLQEISNLTYDKEKKEITVVDRLAQKTLVFDLKGGNIAPKRTSNSN